MYNIHLLQHELISAGLPVIGVSTNGRIDYSRELSSEEQTLSEQIILNHDPNGKLPDEINKEDIINRFLISQLKDKSPEEIYTMMQTRMDNWTSLADARTDLREWLPLMASAIAWITMKD